MINVAVGKNTDLSRQTWFRTDAIEAALEKNVS